MSDNHIFMDGMIDKRVYRHLKTTNFISTYSRIYVSPQRTAAIGLHVNIFKTKYMPMDMETNGKLGALAIIAKRAYIDEAILRVT